MALPEHAQQQLLSALRNAAADLTSRRSIRDLDLTLTHIVAAAVQTMPYVDAAGISLTEHGTITSRAPTDAGVSKLDRLQSELGEGPCITALDHASPDEIVLAQDLDGADAGRWPRFAPHAVEAGYRAILSTGLTIDGGIRASLNLYATTPDAFDAHAQLTAGLFGAQAAMLLYGSDTAAHLQRAVDSRDLIGQAKGILIERFTVDSPGAFQMLVSSSQNTNLKLVDVAHWLVEETTARATPAREPLHATAQRPSAEPNRPEPPGLA